jgi:hypothetical protein
MTTSSITSRRSLHLVDIENLTGGGVISAAALHAALDDYLCIAAWQPDDHVVLAAHPKIIEKIGFDRPVPCSLHAVRGKDSADLMLLSLAPPELVTRRYGRLVIGSGDGIFATRATQASGQGVHVDVVTRIESCSARLLPFEPRWLTAALHLELEPTHDHGDALVTAA